MGTRKKEKQKYAECVNRLSLLIRQNSIEESEIKIEATKREKQKNT